MKYFLVLLLLLLTPLFSEIREEYYDNGQLKFETNYDKGIKNGLTKMYDKYGLLSLSRTYENGVLLDTRFFESNGKLKNGLVLKSEKNKISKTKILYANGEILWKKYYQDGKKLDYKITYSYKPQTYIKDFYNDSGNIYEQLIFKGSLYNYSIYYNSDGSKRKGKVENTKNGDLANYKNGKLHGKNIKNGYRRVVSYYNNGVLDGEKNVYTSSGKFLYKVYTNNGLKEGYHPFIDSSEILRLNTKYHNGKRDGLEISYTVDGKFIQRKTFYKNDVKDGQETLYYREYKDDNQDFMLLKSETDYRYGLKHGKEKNYFNNILENTLIYENGKLISVTTYDVNGTVSKINQSDLHKVGL